MFEIRKATLEDAEMLSAIGGATFLESFIDTIPGSDIVLHMQRQHAPEIYRDYLEADDPRYGCWLAVFAETSAPIGYVVAAPPDLPVSVNATDIELKRIYLFSKFQGSGVAKALSDAFEQHAKACGAERIYLGTYEENWRAVAFYKKAGYEQVGVRQFQVGDQLFDDIIMAKAL